MPFPTLRTERLVLRQCCLADDEQMHNLRSNDQVMQYINRPRSENPAMARKLIEEIQAGLEKDENVTWAITLPENDVLIGTILLFHFDKQNHRGEIGYMLHENFHRQGYMQEAIVKVIDYGFSVLNLHSIEANINPGNVASRGILEQNGFVQEAYFKEDYYWEGKFLDTVILSLINPGH